MDAAQRQRFLGIIVAETERLTRLINQVLDLAKIESGHAEWRSAEVDLRALRDAGGADDGRDVPRARRQRRRSTMPEHVPPLRADRDRLMQVLLNLLSNAAKFVPAEGGRVDDRACAPTPSGVERRGRGQRAGRAGRAAGSSIFEKFRQGGDALRPAAGHRPRPADQPPDRRALRRPHVAAFRAGPGRLLRLRPAVAPRAAADGARAPSARAADGATRDESMQES